MGTMGQNAAASVSAPWWEEGFVLLDHGFFQHWYLLCRGRHWLCSLSHKAEVIPPLRTCDQQGTKAETGGWDEFSRTRWYLSVFFLLPHCYWFAVFLGFATESSFDDTKCRKLINLQIFPEKVHLWWAKGRAVAERQMLVSLKSQQGSSCITWHRIRPRSSLLWLTPPKQTDVIK